MSDRVAEWTIRVCFVLLTVVAVWTVFGDDLTSLIQKR
jgi:hypothetical protein